MTCVSKTNLETAQQPRYETWLGRPPSKKEQKTKTLSYLSAVIVAGCKLSRIRVTWD